MNGGSLFLRSNWLWLLLVVPLTGALAARATAADSRAADDDPSGWAAALQAAPVLPGMQPIAAFPESLLLPPPSDTTFAGLAPSGAGAAPDAAGRWSYLITLDGGAAGQALLFGASGQTDRMNAPLAGESCDEAGTYCMNGAGTERFLALAAGADSATAEHGFDPASGTERWTLRWYDPAADSSYGFSLIGAAAAGVGASGIDPANIAQAQTLAADAAGFVSVSLAPAGSGAAPPGSLPSPVAPAAPQPSDRCSAPARIKPAAQCPPA